MQIQLQTPQIYTQRIQQPSFQGFKTPWIKSDAFVPSGEDLLSLPKKDIFKIIKQSIKNKSNQIGEGGEAEVWNIPDTPYCVRIPYSANIYSDFSLNLTKQDKINHIKAKLGDGASIMERIPGYTYFSKKVSDKEVSKMIENMPVEAYIDLLDQIYNAETSGLLFDNGWKNIIINPDTNKMTAIDFNKAPEGFEQNRILNKVFLCLTSPHSSTEEQSKICAGKLMLAILSKFEANQNFIQKKFGIKDFIDGIVINRGMIEPPCYCAGLKKHFNDIVTFYDLKDEHNQLGSVLCHHYKVVEVLIKQLLGVERTI